MDGVVLEVESQEKRGTHVIIRLPVAWSSYLSSKVKFSQLRWNGTSKRVELV